VRGVLLRVAYLVIVGVIILGLASELYLVLDRRIVISGLIAGNPMRRTIFSLEHASTETLWEIPWRRYKRNALLRVPLGNELYVVQTNRHGFRTRDFELEKPDSLLRIVCIGASTTVQGRTNETTYPALLEKKLRAAFPDRAIQVLNLGISGTHSDYWLEPGNDLAAFQPDVIVQYNAINDICWRYLPALAERRPLRHFLNRSYLLQKLFPLDPHVCDPYFAETLANFERMDSLASACGAAYVVGSFAAPNAAQAEEAFRDFLDLEIAVDWGGAMRLKYYGEYARLLDRYNTLFMAFADERGLRAVPVHALLDEPDLFVDCCHMTPEGIDKLSGIFFASIRDLLAGPGVS